MKKFSLIFIFLLCILLCSCKTNNKNANDNKTKPQSTSSDTTSLPERPTVYGEESDDTFTNINLAIETDMPYYSINDTEISFTLYDKDNKAFKYKNDFFLQVYNNEKWIFYPTKEDAVVYDKVIESTSHFVYMSTDLSEKYILPLPEGTYRIVQEYDTVLVTSNDFKILSSTLEFE